VRASGECSSLWTGCCVASVREVPGVRRTSRAGLVAGKDLEDRAGSGKQRVLSKDIVQLRSEEGAVVKIFRPNSMLAKDLLHLLL
jgi:hypothetical protein